MAVAQKESYNKLEKIRKVPYEILLYLMENNEELWKLLKNTDSIIGIDNISTEEKVEMISKTSSLDENKQVFLQQYSSEAQLFSKPQLRIEIVNVFPTDYTKSLITILFQCIVNDKKQIVQTENSIFDNRGLAMAQNIINSLNGVQPSMFTQELFFDSTIAPVNHIQKVAFGKEFSGYEVLMSCWING